MGKRGWFFSALLHGGVIVAVVLGLPQMFESDALDPSDRPIPVSLVEIADEASAPEPEPVVEPEPPPEAAPEPEPPPPPEPVAEPEPPQVVEPEPEPEPAPADFAALDPAPVLEPEPEPEPPPPAPAEAPEPAPETPEARAEPEPEPAPEPAQDTPPPVPLAKPQDFAALLKNLTDEEPAPPPAPAPEPAAAEEVEPLEDLLESLIGPEDAAPAEAETQVLLTGPERRAIADAIREKVERKWSVPIGVRDAGELLVTLRIQLNQNGSVHTVEIVDDSGSGPNYRTMAESARRAVLKASPFEVLTDYRDSYEGWRDITMTFSPPA